MVFFQVREGEKEAREGSIGIGFGVGVGGGVVGVGVVAAAAASREAESKTRPPVPGRSLRGAAIVDVLVCFCAASSFDWFRVGRRGQQTGEAGS